MKRKDTQSLLDRLKKLLVDLKLKTAASELGPRLLKAGGEDALSTVLDVLEMEVKERDDRRTERLRRASHLPAGKTFDTLDRSRLPRALAQKLDELAAAGWVEEAANVLLFGLPGVGKSHAAAALGHALITRGYSVLFTPTFRLVQELLAAKRDLALPRALRKLDLFDVLVLDDIGYVQQTPEEVEVLFTLMAERYERRSIVITSNLVFSEWDRIFKNPMTTAAAIDRLVHHSAILEFNVPSYRTAGAARKAARPGPPPEAAETESHP
ncbi:MAG: IS21-like element helper ATPase IstB [Candidatus Methylomirabilaceae bacterium]